MQGASPVGNDALIREVLPVITYRLVVAPHCRHRIALWRTNFRPEHGGQRLLLVGRGQTFGILVQAVAQPYRSLELVGLAWVQIHRCGAGQARFEMVEVPPVTLEAELIGQHLRAELSRLAGFTTSRRSRNAIRSILRSGSLAILSDRVPGGLTMDRGAVMQVGRQATLAGRLQLGLRWVQQELRRIGLREQSRRGRLPAAAVANLRQYTIWRRFLPGTVQAVVTDGAACQPVESQGLLLVCSQSPSAVWALRKQDGATVWRRSLPKLGSSGPQLAGSTVFVAAERRLVALDLTSGKIRWTYAPTFRGTHDSLRQPVLSDQACFICIGQRVIRLDLDSGEVVWERPNSGELLAACGDLLLVQFSCWVLALGQQNGGLVWRFDSTPSQFFAVTGAVTKAGWAIFTSTDRILWVRPQNGQIVGEWSVGEEERIYSLTVAEDLVVVVFGGSYHPRTKQLVGLDLGRVVYQLPSNECENIGYDTNTGYLYESGFYGICILDPSTGHRLVDMLGGHHLYSSPLVDAHTIHCFTLDGELWALRHPTRPSERWATKLAKSIQ